MTGRGGGRRGASGIVSAQPGRGFVSGAYYTPMLHTVDSTGSPVQNTEYCVRFEVGTTTTFDRISLEVTTGAASNVVRLGIRQDTGNTYPGALIVDAGTIDASTTGAKELTISQSLNPGRYWLAVVLQGGTGAAIRTRAIDPYVAAPNGANVSHSSYTQTGQSGALGAFSSTVAVSSIGPKIMLRAA